MDQGDGTFAPMPPMFADVLSKLKERAVVSQEDAAQLWPLLFVVGAEVEIRKSRFRIEYIGTDVLLLRLLPRPGSTTGGGT